MARLLIGIALLIIHAVFVFPCDLEGHFDFDVFNDEEMLLYSGCYDAVNKGPHIIEYVLTRERAEARGVTRPSVTFTQDRDGGFLLEVLSENGYFLPSHYDYTYSGYDRGHMAPNADFNDTYENALMTFFIGNIWPQTPEINRGEWLAAEYETRRLASEYNAVKVIIIVDEFTDIKIGDIQVPLAFKRKVYDADSGELLYEITVYQSYLPLLSVQHPSDSEF